MPEKRAIAALKRIDITKALSATGICVCACVYDSLTNKYTDDICKKAEMDLQLKMFFREPYCFFFRVNLAFGLCLGNQIKPLTTDWPWR